MIAQQLRSLKHRAFVAYKPYRFPVAERLEPLFRAAHRVRPPRFDPNDWPGTHLVHDEPLEPRPLEPLPRRIYCFWTGDNPMSANRARSVQALRDANPTIDVVLVTAANLQAFLVPEGTLHPAYEHLSSIHRADYLQCYMAHFHGGGTADIKRPTAGWASVFDRMDGTDAWMAGYRVPVRLMTPNMPDPALEKTMRRFSEIRLGQCAYLNRPRTPLTREWWRALNLTLDSYAHSLEQNPGNARGDNPGYPLHLNAILAQLVDPLEVKYREHLMYDQRLYMQHHDYL